MSKIKIETLSPVHIGSGNILQNGNDFVLAEDDGEPCIVIIDPGKVMKFVGEKNIDAWVLAIENGRSTDDIVRQYAPRVTAEEYAKRIILDYDENIKPHDTLKEFIHDGMGKPYIPGSSIKGAIRTALLDTLAGPEHERLIDPNPKKMKAAPVEKRLFGESIEKDVFRFLQVGDACFGENYEIAIRMVNLNERKQQPFWDKSKQQLIEALVEGDESSFELRIKKPFKSSISLPEPMRTIPELFKTINAHTLKLLDEEISYWEERSEKDSKGKVDKYIAQIEKIVEQAQNCADGRECVLRIGHGSGWRFITGAWTENMSIFQKYVVPASRPQNFKYEEYDFPKTRRIDVGCIPLGFVKLTISD